MNAFSKQTKYWNTNLVSFFLWAEENWNYPHEWCLRPQKTRCPPRIIIVITCNTAKFKRIERVLFGKCLDNNRLHQSFNILSNGLAASILMNAKCLNVIEISISANALTTSKFFSQERRFQNILREHTKMDSNHSSQ